MLQKFLQVREWAFVGGPTTHPQQIQDGKRRPYTRRYTNSLLLLLLLFTLSLFR